MACVTSFLFLLIGFSGFVCEDVFSGLVVYGCVLLIIPVVLCLSGLFVGRVGSRHYLFSMFCIHMGLVCGLCIDVLLHGSLYSSLSMGWFTLDLTWFQFGFIYDNISVWMLGMVSLVTFFVSVYIMAYMWGDPFYVNFCAYILLFAFCMLFLVCSDNVLLFFFGWEGIGICSFLLIGFWSHRLKANNSSLNAMVVNRISDVLLSFGLLLVVLFYSGGTFYGLGSSAVVSWSLCDMSVYVEGVVYLLLCGVIGKSSQFGLHVWLPDAMEGPTPVSALIHAATLVTAGLYFVIRFSYMFEDVSHFLWVSVGFGSLTLMFSSFVGLFQYDVNRVIAYSTCSQLGFIYLCCGFSSYLVGYYHLLNHAGFKALLFLVAGYIIHIVSNDQDLSQVGSLVRCLPLIYVCFEIAHWCLVGFPYMSGFFSKDVVLESSFSSHGVCGVLGLSTLFLSVICTMLYSSRSFVSLFFFNYLGFRRFLLGIVEAPLVYVYSLGLLVLVCFGLGCYLYGFFGVGLFNSWSGIFYGRSGYWFDRDVEYGQLFYVLWYGVFGFLIGFVLFWSGYGIYLLRGSARDGLVGVDVLFCFGGYSCVIFFGLFWSGYLSLFGVVLL